MGRAHLARGHPDLGRASARRERGNQRDPDDQSTIRHLTSPPLRKGELPLRVSVSRDSIRQIFRGAEAGYNATLVPTVFGSGAPRRTHVGAVGLGRFPSPVRHGEITLALRGWRQTDDGGIKGGWRPL